MAGGIRLSTRLALAMVSLVLVTTAVLSFITYHSVTEAAIPRALDRLATQAALSAARLAAALNGARRDVLMIQSGVGVARLAAGVPTRQAAEKQIRESIEVRFASILRAKPEYAQLRIIGAADGGRELVRVDRKGPGGASRAVPAAELIRVGERDYFKRTIGLSSSDVYVSPVRAQADGSPDQAVTVHVAIPLRTPDGQQFGIGVIDFDLEPEFNRIRADAAEGAQILIANGAGDYLVHPDRSREFASVTGAHARASRTIFRGSMRHWRPELLTRAISSEIETAHGLGWVGRRCCSRADPD